MTRPLKHEPWQQGTDASTVSMPTGSVLPGMTRVDSGCKLYIPTRV